MTVIEVIGLTLVIGAGFAAAPVAEWTAPPAPEWSGVAAATIFAFFAFIGFDDIVNIAEETHAPGHTMPRAILGALAITGLLYMLVSLAAVRAVPRDVLGASERPLALVWEAGVGTSAAFLAAIAVAFLVAHPRARLAVLVPVVVIPVRATLPAAFVAFVLLVLQVGPVARFLQPFETDPAGPGAFLGAGCAGVVAGLVVRRTAARRAA
jgi:amino acid transporter